MFDSGDPQVSVDATEGRSRTSTIGDRLMVVLAAVALLSGAAIGLGKLLPPPDPETSAATPTLQQSAAPSRTPRPSVKLEKPLITFSVGQEPLPPLSLRNQYWEGWARVLRRVNEYAFPGALDEPIATLRPGDVVWATDDPDQNRYGEDWLAVSAPVNGFIHQRTGAEPVIDRVIWRGNDGVGVQSIIPGPQGQFLLFGWRWPNAILGFTDGGNTWQAVEPAGMLERLSWFDAAYGPAGWIAVVEGERYVGRPWIWQSDDGRAWRPLGRLAEVESNAGGWRIVGSERGYVMTAQWRDASTDTDNRIWYSADGQTWAQRPIPIVPNSLVASAVGFYAYNVGDGFPTIGAFSADGWDWATVESAEFGQLIGVAGSGDGLVALDREDGSVHAWVSRSDGATIAWEPAPTGEFDGAVVTGLGSGSAAMALGFDRESRTALWWNHDAGGWHRHELPAEFGTIPRIGAATEGGFMLVGAGESPIAEEPVIWGSTGSSLQPESTPFIRGSGSPTPADCAAAKPDLVGIMSNSPVTYAVCHGDRPLTMDAYLAPCRDCGDYGDERELRPAWLASPRRMLRLSPIESADWSSFDGVRAPGLRARSSWEGHWVTVTGHFDDPAAASCREILTPETEVWYGGRAQLFRDCRSRFVVTSVELIR